MQPDLQAIAQKIREIARAEILSRFERVGYEFKDDGSVLTEADLAAGTLILAEAGGYSSALNGEPVSLTQLANNSVVASPDPDLFAEWFGFLKTYND